MRLTMAERRVLIKSFAPCYRKKPKKVKGEVTQMTGYNRASQAYLKNTIRDPDYACLAGRVIACPRQRIGASHVVPETGPINQGVKRGLTPN